MSAERPAAATGRVLLQYALPTIAAVYPWALAYGTYAGLQPFNPLGLWRALAVSAAVGPILFWSFQRIIRDPDTRALWLAIMLLAIGCYGFLGDLVPWFGRDLLPTPPGTAIAYLFIVAIATTIMLRPWRPRAQSLVPWVLFAAALVLVNTLNGVARTSTNVSSKWQPAADAITHGALKGPQAIVRPTRDVYYIVLDALGRADTLRNVYGLDVSGFTGFLRGRGFFVADDARSNYMRTVQSFSSFLNLDYIDPINETMGRQGRSWLPFVDLIQHNGLMRVAKRAGYQVVAIGSDYYPTSQFPEADVCVCQRLGLTMFEQVVLDETVLAGLPVDRWTHGAHVEMIRHALDSLEHLPPSTSRRFVFVHVVSPHPPFVFASDGSIRQPPHVFSFSDGSDFPGSHAEYVRGYRDQAMFITARVRAIVDAILSRPGPQPVIVIHSDHGPGSMLDQNDPDRSSLPERMNIFAAYYFPDGPAGLYSSITPVNGARALANAYFGTALPRLPDRSWFSPETRPYDLTAVPDTPADWPR